MTYALLSVSNKEGIVELASSLHYDYEYDLISSGGTAKDNIDGAVLASDGFFPFGDTVRLANDYGIKAVIQPGGSIKDQESIDACNELGMTMVFTGKRHFLH